MIRTNPGASPAVSQGGAEPDLDLAEIGRLLLRRRRVIFGCLAAIVLLAGLYLLLAKRRYHAEAQLQLLTEAPSANISDFAAGDTDTSALGLSITMQTYVGVLTSERLAWQVIRELQLENTPEYRTDVTQERNLPLEQAPRRRELLVKHFEKNLAVSPGSGSRLLTVSFQSVEPARAKSVVDRLVNDFLAYNAGVRFDLSERTEGWLGGQLSGLKSQVERAEQTAAQAQRDTGIYGTDETHNLVLARLEALQQSLINAEQNRIVKGTVLHVVQGGDPEAISNLSGAAGQASAPGSVNSLALIQTLRGQEAVLSGQYAELTSKFGAAYPQVIEVQKQLGDVRQSIAREASRLTARAANDYTAAKEQEDAVQREVASQKELANRSNDASIRYLIAAHEATSTRELYEHLLERSKELGVVAGLGSHEVEILDPAHVDTSPKPGVLTVLAAAGAVGLFLGVLAAFLRDSLDPALFSAGMAQQLTGLPLLGVLPKVDARVLNGLQPRDRKGSEGSVSPLYSFASTHPDARFTEALRFVRARLRALGTAAPTKILLIASAARGEGKGVVAINLGTLLAGEGLRVLVVDADLRHGELSDHLGCAGRAGLSDLLAQASSGASPQPLLGLDFLPAGFTLPVPAEQLASTALRELAAGWQPMYDFVLLTAAPLSEASDVLTLAPLVDGVVLVTRARQTLRRALVHAYQLLAGVQAPLLGTVYNAAGERSL